MLKKNKRVLENYQSSTLLSICEAHKEPEMQSTKFIFEKINPHPDDSYTPDVKITSPH